MTANEEAWDDLDSDEIRSIDSEELYETRPNRWRGDKSTWNTYTEEERLLHRSMEQLRNRDLSVHLYNSFMLRNRPTCQAATTETDAEDADKPLEDIVDNTNWRPPNSWTAWPMNAREVPGDDFMKESRPDGDEEFTTRSSAVPMPSTALEEEITASILRQAKERFLQRQQKQREKEAARAESVSVRETTAVSTQESSNSSGDEGGSTSEVHAHAGPSNPSLERSKPKRTYEAVVSANDELSASLLRPSVRHIISNLDNTLTTLHNSRLAGLSYMTDSSASATDASDDSDVASRSSVASRASSKRSRRGPPRSKAPRTPEPERDPWERRGRKKKVHVPLPGETHKEMQIRLAREQKKRIPFSSDEESNNEDGGEDEEDDNQEDSNQDDEGDDNEDDNRDDNGDKRDDEDDDDGGDGKRRKDRGEASPAKSSRRKRDIPPEARVEARIKNRETMLGNWGLRDWSDVLGAAAISGFKPEVVARAAQRCANLFGQGMDMVTIPEGPASKGPKPQRTRYVPGKRPREASPSSSDSEDARPARPSRRRVRDSVPPSDSDGRGSRARSTSRSSSIGLFFCPVAGCERATEGFGRRANLQRHVARVHPGQAVDLDGVESENEMDGAVHVDGFLKPIRPRKGWRGEDTGTRKRKKHYRGRRGENTSDSPVEESVWDSS